jgi:hypothetical protein
MICLHLIFEIAVPCLLLVGGFKHVSIIFHNLWDVILNPLTNSIIFQDGYCTTNQVAIFDHFPWFFLTSDLFFALAKAGPGPVDLVLL